MSEAERRKPYPRPRYVTRREFNKFRRQVDERLRRLESPPGATRATIVLGGSNMPGQITVDTANEKATVQFADDHGDVVPAPSGASVAFASSDESVASVAPDPADPFSADVTPHKEGKFDLSASLANALKADGTPIEAPAPVTVTVGPGPAAGASLVLSV